MRAEAAYAELIAHFRELAVLESCEDLLGWDEETYMPPRGVEHRGNQLALLAGMTHDRLTHPRVGELLADLAHADLVQELHSVPETNVRELRRLYTRAIRLPRLLVEEITRTTCLAQQAWTVAYRKSDFPSFQPWLEKIVVLMRQQADALGYATVAYDALLDEYEPGARSDQLADLFAALRKELVPLANHLTAVRRRPNGAILRRAFPVDRQRQFAQRVALAIGFDFQRGRLDSTTHPFCMTIGPHDCRITTRYDQGFCDAFFGMLHELGHGLYEQGLDPDHYGTPMGESGSVGVHESQARLWENTIGRSLSFWQYFYPALQEAFPESLRDVGLDEFHLAINNVEATPVRVGSDEVTYNLHVMLRFELEQALLKGDLPVSDLPGAWNEAYRHYLGITPKNDREGCLQDSHWSEGIIGYFPTYTLGNIMAAQLFARAQKDLGDLDAAFGRGDFTGLLGWLRAKVHRHGQRYSATELIEAATGSPPDHCHLIGALRRRYGELYGLAEC